MLKLNLILIFQFVSFQIILETFEEAKKEEDRKIKYTNTESEQDALDTKRLKRAHPVQVMSSSTSSMPNLTNLFKRKKLATQAGMNFYLVSRT